MARFMSGGLIALGAVLAFGAATPGRAGDEPTPAGAQGMVIYRDPATGRLGVPPAGVIPPPAPALVPRGVAERAGTSPAGGVLLDVVPRFTMTATTDGAGHATARCDRRDADAGE